MVANKSGAWFKGVTNSGISPVDDFDIDEAYEALLDPPYLVALLQRAFYNENAYDVNDPRWENVSPAEYRKEMNIFLAKLEDNVLAALEIVQTELTDKYPQPTK